MGRERSEESGLAYYGARWYAPWLARCAGCDPIRDRSRAECLHSDVARLLLRALGIDIARRVVAERRGGTPTTPEETSAFEDFLASEGSTALPMESGGYADVPTVVLKA
jgi:hypothetical protein